MVPKTLKSGKAISPLWFGALLFLALWEILLFAQNPGIMADDSGEFAAAACTLGLPHPPGYPLLCLVNRLAVFIPVSSPAFRLNLLSETFVLCSVLLCLGIFSRLSREANRLFLLWLALIFIGCRDVFAQSLSAKGSVYTLTLLLTCLMFWLWQGRDGKGHKLLALPFFIWALGMANHWQTHLVWLPFLAYWVYQERVKWNLKETLKCLGFILLGLSPYLYLPLRGNLHPLPLWGNPDHWQGFLWVATRQLVVGTENLRADFTFYQATLWQFLRAYSSHWLPGFVLGLIPGIYFLWKGERKFLTGTLWLGLGVLVAVIFIHDIKNTYLVPLYLLSISGWVLVVAGYGCWCLLQKLRSWKKTIVLLALLAQCLWIFHVYKAENKSRFTLAGDFADNVLLGLPRNAVLIGEGDHYVMGLWDALYARDERPDVTFEPGVFLVHDWGWRQIARQNGDWSALCQTPLFQERLETLTSQPLRHPLFYSLDNDKLRLALIALGGRWTREGLAMRWIEIQEGKRMEPSSAQTRRLYSLQRFRWEAGDENAWDPSSQVILGYYRGEESKNPKE